MSGKMHGGPLQEAGRGMNGGFSRLGCGRRTEVTGMCQVEGYRGWVVAFRVLSGAQFSTHPNRNAFFGCPWR